MIVLLAALALAQAPVVPQDEATLVVRVDTQEVAREMFRLVERRRADSASGWVLGSTARWSGGRRPAVLSPVIELTPDSEPGALVFDVAGDATTLRITGQPGHGRYTLRYIAPGLERARELPVRAPTVIVDDSVLATYLITTWHVGPPRPPGSTGTPTILTAIYPRSPRIVQLTVSDLGMAATTLNRDPTTLHHFLLSGGPEGAVHIWLATDGRLMKVELPERGLRAERLPG